MSRCRRLADPVRHGPNSHQPGASGSAGPTDANASADSASEKIKLQFWTSSRADTNYIMEKIKAFNETNKDNIEVEMTTMAENLPQSLDLAFASEQAPDVFQGPSKDQYDKGYIEPLNGYLDDGMKQEFGSGFREGSSVLDGNMISLANYGTTVRLVYNAGVFDKLGLQPPKTLGRDGGRRAENHRLRQERGAIRLGDEL